jgi:hypothetical protein
LIGKGIHEPNATDRVDEGAIYQARPTSTTTLASGGLIYLGCLTAIEYTNTMTDATTASLASLRFADLSKRRDNASRKITGKS